MAHIISRMGTGLKLHVSGLTRLSLHLGERSSIMIFAGVLLDYGEVSNVLLKPGRNEIDLTKLIPAGATLPSRTLVQINVQDVRLNRLHLEKIEMNSVSPTFSLCTYIPETPHKQGAKLLPYQPQELVFQFIGDSLTTVCIPNQEASCRHSNLGVRGTGYLILYIRAGATFLVRGSKLKSTSKRSQASA